MRSMKLLLGAVAALVFVGCNNGQPRLYKIAVDASPLLNLPSQCYLDNTQPNQRYSVTKLMMEQEWAIWDGADGQRFLDLGNASWQLGEADRISFNGLLIESSKDDNLLFNGQQSSTRLPEQGSTYSNTLTQSIVVKFDSLGSTASGSFTVTTQYTCSNCQNNDNKIANCSAKFDFTGRRIDADNQNMYTTDP